MAVELVREKLFRRLNNDLPYRLTPRLQHVTQLKDGRLHCVIDVAVKSSIQKAIVVGSKGSVMQDYVVTPSEKELSHLFGQPVQLVVRVSVDAKA